MVKKGKGKTQSPPKKAREASPVRAASSSTPAADSAPPPNPSPAAQPTPPASSFAAAAASNPNRQPSPVPSTSGEAMHTSRSPSPAGDNAGSKSTAAPQPQPQPQQQPTGDQSKGSQKVSSGPKGTKRPLETPSWRLGASMFRVSDWDSYMRPPPKSCLQFVAFLSLKESSLTAAEAIVAGAKQFGKNLVAADLFSQSRQL